jgi:hypothetical protein
LSPETLSLGGGLFICYIPEISVKPLKKNLFYSEKKSREDKCADVIQEFLTFLQGQRVQVIVIVWRGGGGGAGSGPRAASPWGR